VGTRDAALASMAWPACAGGCGPRPRSRRSRAKQRQSRWLIQTDTWAGSRAACTAWSRPARIASSSTASRRWAAKAVMAVSAS